MNDIKFKPVILGIDVGAYSVARTFYEFYNVKYKDLKFKILNSLCFLLL